MWGQILKYSGFCWTQSQSTKEIPLSSGRKHLLVNRLSLWDKIAAANLLGKKLKLFVERVEVENPQDEVLRLMVKKLKDEQSQAKELEKFPSQTDVR
jgi:hypothetical protein